ncbi:LolA family protein [Alteriqipengyuania lutimaris]|uniref:Outer membrane lipoprotein carrier protein LolA n=1 Tax=Alteriqipengyuania lutimaris TaxID=1538146 RepID=A0A395LJM6_9SPHN|nr:outer membrane lipoprotein carrier protein LolA [Alteriqipengyuania lutimaris]MBB3034166.1 outer membrane lipoprotein-sorting protein [Alteriqipengyuania lutimaris]RDS76905.1 outer membrane lipoprotein carrier protein LolA [Alteriqipengyuania lutimaris]
MTTMKDMLRRPLAGLATLAMLGAAPVATVALPTAAVAQSDKLDNAVSALRGISTMRANFTQTDRAGQTVSGVMTLKRPGKIRFEYAKGVPLLVVSNGKSLTMIDYEVNQVQRWPIGNSPLGALLDPNRDVKKYGKLVSTGNPDVLSVEVRDPNKPEYGTITLIFVRNANAPAGWQLTNWVALDAQNNRTTVRLSNHRYGLSVSDSSFTYKDPRRASRRPQ